MGDSSGGEARLAPVIVRSALSTGLIGAIYMETHPEPLTGGSDIHNVIPLMYMEELLKTFKAIDEVSKVNKLRLEDWHQEGKSL